MIRFDMRRFGRLARWALGTDAAYYRRWVLQLFVVVLLMFLFFTTVVRINGGRETGHQVMGVVVMLMVVICVVMGPAFMFQSMTGRHDRQRLLLLPASNLEKYLVRYVSWLFVLFLTLAVILTADLLQYTMHWLLGHDDRRWVMETVWLPINPRWTTWNQPLDEGLAFPLVALLCWLHSCYALGATFFRVRKYGWVLTTMVLIALGMLEEWLLPDVAPFGHDIVVAPVAYGWGLLALSALNFLLSYRLFCRMQVVGRFMNI